MSYLVKGLDLGKIIKEQSGKLLSNVDFSAVKLPEATGSVELGEETQGFVVKILLGVVAFFILTKMLR